MSNLTTINVQVDEIDKEKVIEILDELGLTLNDLINMTIKQVILNNGIPFEIAIPNYNN